ncbi:MAG TPA: NUDIX domain-containing protein [Pyrinomonadaceae bacterium]|nr:NUDIX domain-containing protein [Pyrinomonadaceae bacterium]
MPKRSAGILLYRRKNGFLEIFLAHPGGPFWKNKDKGVWSIPKGEFTNEKPLDAAKREFKEETGFDVPGPGEELTPIKQKGGKWVHAWAVEGDLDADEVTSNTFSVKYASGLVQEFPEVDRAGWFTMDEAREKILESQSPLLTQLADRLGD